MSNEKIIWDYFKKKGLTDCGVAGLMGNLYAESGLNPTNLQNSFESKFKYSDSEYTARVDRGWYTNFAKDGAGYGLAQWTYWTRKQNLLTYAKNKDKSIGDLEMQLDFLYEELSKSFQSVLKALKSAKTVLEASNIVLFKFERPANQNLEVQTKRAEYSQVYYNKYAVKEDKIVEFTNSSLVDYTKISQHRTSPRRHAIDTITIHCYVGQASVESAGSWFSNPKARASANYMVGADGRIALIVEEKDRAWTSSNDDNDHRAITIEVACDKTHPYAVRDVVMDSLIELLVDICKRNDIKKLLWKADKSLIGQVDKQNMTVHRWFKNKACPGEYLYERHGWIADEVNKRLGTYDSNDSNSIIPTVDTSFSIGDEVKLVEGAEWADGTKPKSWVYNSKLYVRGYNNNKVNCIVSTQKTGAITGVARTEDLVAYTDGKAAATTTFKSYMVKITADVLNVRSGPGTTYKVNTTVRKNGIYTIIAENNGWGKLKSGAGWISLKYTTKV